MGEPVHITDASLSALADCLAALLDLLDNPPPDFPGSLMRLESAVDYQVGLLVHVSILGSTLSPGGVPIEDDVWPLEFGTEFPFTHPARLALLSLCEVLFGIFKRWGFRNKGGVAIELRPPSGISRAIVTGSQDQPVTERVTPRLPLVVTAKEKSQLAWVLSRIRPAKEEPTTVECVEGSRSHLLSHLGWTPRYGGKLIELVGCGAIKLEELPQPPRRSRWRMVILKPELAFNRGPGAF